MLNNNTGQPETGKRLLLKGAEVAQLCGWSRAKAYQMMANGILPVVRCGRSVRVNYGKLAEWIERQTEGGGV